MDFLFRNQSINGGKRVFLNIRLQIVFYFNEKTSFTFL